MQTDFADFLRRGITNTLASRTLYLLPSPGVKLLQIDGSGRGSEQRRGAHDPHGAGRPPRRAPRGDARVRGLRRGGPGAHLRVERRRNGLGPKPISALKPFRI